MTKSRDRKIRHILEAVVAAFLSAFHISFQYVTAGPPATWAMLVPLVTYIVSLLRHPDFLRSEMPMLLFSRELMFGRIVAVAGFIIFLMACIQFLRSRGKLIKTGLYSVVRHPQYFGMTAMTLGISIMCMRLSRAWGVFVFASCNTGWLIQVLGYVLLAGYEEQHLLREYKREYKKYREKVPFIFPAPCPTKIPEPLFSMGLALIIILLCTFIVTSPF